MIPEPGSRRPALDGKAIQEALGIKQRQGETAAWDKLALATADVSSSKAMDVLEFSEDEEDPDPHNLTDEEGEAGDLPMDVDRADVLDGKVDQLHQKVLVQAVVMNSSDVARAPSPSTTTATLTTLRDPIPEVPDLVRSPGLETTGCRQPTTTTQSTSAASDRPDSGEPPTFNQSAPSSARSQSKPSDHKPPTSTLFIQRKKASRPKTDPRPSSRSQSS
jgi:hypothetical protein